MLLQKLLEKEHSLATGPATCGTQAQTVQKHWEQGACVRTEPKVEVTADDVSRPLSPDP